MASAYEEAKAQRDALEEELNAATAVLKRFPRSAIGLVPDSIKFSPEYRAAKEQADRAFAKLRAFNTGFIKRFAKEIRAEPRYRRAAPKENPSHSKGGPVVNRAVKKMQAYLGAVDRAPTRTQERLYKAVLADVNRIADDMGMYAEDVWEQVEVQARKLARPGMPGRDW